MKKMIESKVLDKRGNLIISQGLKVRHRDSRFEYTVDSVVKDKSGNIVILLRDPESPRISSVKVSGAATLTDKQDPSKVIYDVDLRKNFSDSYYEPEENEPPSPDDLIVVPKNKFEKEYEVV